MMLFTDIPGMKMKQYPKELSGTYQYIQKAKNQSDTQIITVSEHAVEMNMPLIERLVSLNDTDLLMSHFGHFYFLNFKKDSIGNQQAWLIYPFNFDEKSLYIYPLMLDNKSSKRMIKCGIEPEKKAGFFRMDNEAFKKYCQKYLKKRHATKLKRIN